MLIRTLITKWRRRPFPSNLHALRRCRISYSQFGEDLCVTSLLGYERTQGIYVDVGCFHPIDFSNTYLFYQRGWSGVAIDPNPVWGTAWQRYRPRDRFVNCAIAASTGTASYVMHRNYPACNRISATLPERLAPDETVRSVPVRPLSDVLEQYLGDVPIDLLSVDCEGYDRIALASLDFSRWKPTVIVAEERVTGEATGLSDFLEPRGYVVKARMGLSTIFQLA